MRRGSSTQKERTKERKKIKIKENLNEESKQREDKREVYSHQMKKKNNNKLTQRV